MLLKWSWMGKLHCWTCIRGRTNAKKPQVNSTNKIFGRLHSLVSFNDSLSKKHPCVIHLVVPSDTSFCEYSAFYQQVFEQSSQNTLHLTDTLPNSDFSLVN
ncbi:hypothetical protein CSKR_202309 [Clonorchis sinensis]|uniref:Uncharacterized protein n=1 Tax=Clonorchis sinensis TaxID=79923 RepID=A0A8T1MV71_CLOSI|nr:hypothetical protein CSKR_202309 [Clonorchis sinensis]